MKNFLTLLVLMITVLSFSSCSDKDRMHKQHASILDNVEKTNTHISNKVSNYMGRKTYTLRIETPTELIYLDSVQFYPQSSQIFYRYTVDNRRTIKRISSIQN